MSSVPGEEVSGNSFPEAHLPPVQKLLVRESFENPDGEVQSLLETLSRRDVEIDGLKERMKFQDASYQTIRHMLKEHNDQIQSTYKKQVARLEERLKSQTDNYTRKIKEMRNTILENVDGAVRKELEEKNETERKVTELEQKITEFEHMIMELENETLSRNVSFLERIYEKDTQIKTLSENKIEYQHILKDRDTQLADCQEEITELNEKLQLLDDEENEKVLTLKNEIKELTEKMTELEEDRDCKIASLKSKIYEQNEVLSDRDSQIAALKIEIEKIASLESEIREQNLVLSDRDRQITVLKTEIEKIASLESEIREQNLVLGDRDRQITVLKTEIEKIASLKSEIYEQNKVLSDRDSQITALKTEIEELVRENNNKDELLADLKSKIDTLKEEKDLFQKVERVEGIVGLSPTQEDESEKLKKLKTLTVCLERLQISENDAVENVIPRRHTRARAAAYEISGKENQTFVGKTPRDKSKKNGARERTPLGVSALNDSSDINVFRSAHEKGKTPDRRHITKKMVQKLFATSPSCDPSETQVYTYEKKKLFSVSPSADHLEINYEQSGDTSRIREMTTPMQTVKLLKKKK